MYLHFPILYVLIKLRFVSFIIYQFLIPSCFYCRYFFIGAFHDLCKKDEIKKIKQTRSKKINIIIFSLPGCSKFNYIVTWASYTILSLYRISWCNWIWKVRSVKETCAITLVLAPVWIGNKMSIKCNNGKIKLPTIYKYKKGEFSTCVLFQKTEFVDFRFIKFNPIKDVEMPFSITFAISKWQYPHKLRKITSRIKKKMGKYWTLTIST